MSQGQLWDVGNRPKVRPAFRKSVRAASHLNDSHAGLIAAAERIAFDIDAAHIGDRNVPALAARFADLLAVLGLTPAAARARAGAPDPVNAAPAARTIADDARDIRESLYGAGA